MPLTVPARLLASGAAIAVVLTACGGGGDTLSTDNVRARAQLADAGPSAVYLDITNDTDEDTQLVSVSVPSDVAGSTELHETVPADDDMTDGDMTDGDMTDDDMTDGEMSGMEGMQMVQVEGIDIPAGETVSLEPGGLHIMLLELPDDLAAGDAFEATLEFDDGETTTVDVEVTTTP